MKRRRGNFEVFSMSAIDLFASAMGAFVIITIVLIPDYRKEVLAQGDQSLLERLRAESEDALENADQRRSEAEARLAFAQREVAELMAQASQLRNELEQAREQWIAEHDPPPPPEPQEETIPDDRVSFRFLGLKTRQDSFLFLVDMNRYLEPHADLLFRAVERALGSLKDHHEFAILAYNQHDDGVHTMRWPAGGGLVNATPARQAEGLEFLRRRSGEFAGPAPTLHALEQALESEAAAIVLFSDGLPNPKFNDGLNSGAIVQRIARANRGAKEIHAVTIGDYFKYRNTVEFMEALARENGGGFMALSQ